MSQNDIEFIKIKDIAELSPEAKFINVYCKIIKDMQSKYGDNTLCKVITIRDNKNNILKQQDNLLIAVQKKKLQFINKKFFRISVIPQKKEYQGKQYYETKFAQIPPQEFNLLDLYNLSNQSQFNLEIETN